MSNEAYKLFYQVQGSRFCIIWCEWYESLRKLVKPHPFRVPLSGSEQTGYIPSHFHPSSRNGSWLGGGLVMLVSETLTTNTDGEGGRNAS